MTPRTLFAVLVAAIGVWYVCGAATMLLSIVTGPFASLVVGIIVLFIAKSVYNDHGATQ